MSRNEEQRRAGRLRPRELAIQGAIVFVVVAALATVVATTLGNLEDRGIELGLTFLEDRAGFTIPESILAYTPDDTNVRAILVGIGNTLYVTTVVAALSTILGALIGVGRISPEPVLAAAARFWVDVTRNVPPILLLIFLYSLLGAMLPADRAAAPGLGVLASQRGIAIPVPALPDGAGWMLVATVVGWLAFALLTRRWRDARVRRLILRRIVPAALLLGLLALFILRAPAAAMRWPAAEGADLTDGLILSPEFVSLVVGLTFYTSGFIAEIVRAGLQAVARGQWEAAAALGLGRRHVLRLVVFPQMIRVILPAMTSQFINVLKNSTLVIAVGFTDFLVVMGTIINRTSHAVEGTAIIVSVYLTISLSFSAVMARVDRRLRLASTR